MYGLTLDLKFVDITGFILELQRLRLIRCAAWKLWKWTATGNFKERGVTDGDWLYGQSDKDTFRHDTENCITLYGQIYS